ncbi:hypothetical protein O181_046861 [Austropuccinia psidii MF-1]|uniref:Uncharacterized protein n=1 Tax=Austropuccinia psidii MF-1 TaxID=1389203 RepID=A0A9Q3HJ12_9BASI|nr:hypothetical protein [Austropuccinia psidii MF-1]
MDNWGNCQPPIISTGREPSGYAHGLSNTEQRIENEDTSKAQSQLLPKTEVIQPPEILKKETSIPDGLIDNDDQEEEKVMIPTRYKSPRPSETNE